MRKDLPTTSNRALLIRLAKTMPVGSEDRRAILAGLSRSASRFPPEAEDFNKVEDADGFWAWSIQDAKKQGLRLSPESIGDVIFFLNMAAAAWERKSRTAANHRKAELDKAAVGAATVSAFLTVASSKLTQYDQRLEAKQPNMYRLGHYLRALNIVREDVKDVMNDDSPDALGRLRASLMRQFNTLPPITATIKQINDYLTTGKLPRLVR